jgi:uncharacterized membrane protein YgcG|uniref:Neurotoxin n=1 Tax=Myoviridae sp. ctg8M33 TaxID=2826680 RepID=A0A8S5NLH7_9CAUD|nr:MAG TPA: neurotoxin [Myoviridae sp. ctg8M33]
MGKATQPVSINGLEFDALIDESRTLEATVPEYSVESGFSVSDSVILNPEKLSMTLFVTNTPVTWYRRHGASPTRVDNVVKQLEELYFAKEPVTIVTSDATYTSMAIESITISKSLEIGYARQIPISFKKIRVTTAKTTTIPDSYGKSGATAASAGTASTSTGSSGGGSGSGSGSGGGSSGAGGSSGSNGNSKSSILYNAANSIGLI